MQESQPMYTSGRGLLDALRSGELSQTNASIGMVKATAVHLIPRDSP